MSFPDVIALVHAAILRSALPSFPAQKRASSAGVWARTGFAAHSAAATREKMRRVVHQPFFMMSPREPTTQNALDCQSRQSGSPQEPRMRIFAAVALAA